MSSILLVYDSLTVMFEFFLTNNDPFIVYFILKHGMLQFVSLMACFVKLLISCVCETTHCIWVSGCELVMSLLLQATN